MSSDDPLQALLAHPQLWRSGRWESARQGPVATGFPQLDRQLGGGWPRAALTELLLPGQGIGELRLLVPALLRLSQQNTDNKNEYPDGFPALIACVAPPWLPYPPAFAQCGFDLSRLLVVESDSALDSFWATEQLLHSALCVAVLSWLPSGHQRLMRRLQLAAAATAAGVFVFRPARAAAEPSPAPLRICIQAKSGGLWLRFGRNRYGSTEPFWLSW